MVELEHLYREIRDLRVVDSQKEFSELFGKRASWYSSTLARRRKPGIDALVRFYLSLNEIEQETRDAVLSETDGGLAQNYLNGVEQISNLRFGVALSLLLGKLSEFLSLFRICCFSLGLIGKVLFRINAEEYF